ncbi:MAG: glutaredoxin 3 [Rhodospirillales bacterium]|nr:glutaredoxin 3 [Rhodospirillales bacterium]
MAEVEIYTSLLCGFCYRAKRLLETKGIAFSEYNLLAEPQRRREMLERAGGRTSVPQIFIDGVHIGGCDELYALEAAGKLNPLLKTAA